MMARARSLGMTRPGRARVALIVVGLVALAAPAAPAAPIRQRQRQLRAATPRPPRADRSLGAFLAGGPQAWIGTRAPAFPAGLRLRANAVGLLPDNDIVSYLTYRRGLNASRFDFNHPRTGPLLAENQLLRTIPPAVVAPMLIAPPAIPEIPAPARISTQNIPEPSTWAIAALIIGAAFGWRRRSARG